MTAASLVPLSVAVPLLAAALVPVVSHCGGRRGAIDAFALAAALASVAIDAALLLTCLKAPVVYWFGGWLPVGGFALGIPFLAEPVAVGGAVLAATLTFAGLLFSSRHFKAYGTFFHSLLLVFLAAMTGFCLAADLFNQFVFFELMGVAAYALTGYDVEDTGPLEGGLNFAVINSIGAIAILMGIGIVYGATGSLTMVDVGRRLAERGADLLVMTALGLLLCGYFVKGALFPFHFWLPDAHAVAPTAASVLFSGIMVETALIGGVRTMRWVFAPALGAHDAEVRTLLLFLGAGAALLGAVMAPLQRHLKRLLAFSTISHAGIMASAVGLVSRKALAGMFLYILGHGLVKGALFCCAGILLHRHGNVDEIDLRGRGRGLKSCAILFFLAAAGLAGLPPFATFPAKALMDEGAKQAACHWFPLVAAVATALTTAAVLRAGIRIFFGWGGRDGLTETARVSGTTERRETHDDKGKTPLSMLLATALLVAAAAVAGSFPAVSQGVDAAVSLYAEPAAAQRVVLDGATAPVSPGEPAQVDGKVVGVAVATAAAALILAAGLLEVPGKKSAFSRKIITLVKPLRDIHSGHVGDYAAWFVAGCGSLLVVLALMVM